MTFGLGCASWQRDFQVLWESTQSVVLGLFFLSRNRALHDFRRGILQLWDVCVPLLRGVEMVPVSYSASMSAVVTMPPLSEVLVLVTVSLPRGSDFEGYSEPNIPGTTGGGDSYSVMCGRRCHCGLYPIPWA